MNLKKMVKCLVRILMAFILLASLQQPVPIQAKSSQDIKLDVSVNFGKYVKPDRFAEAHIKVTAGSQNFKGYVQAILYRKGIQDNSLYHTKIHVKAKSKKNVRMEIPILNGLKKIIFCLVDENGKEVIRKTESLKVEEDLRVTFLGVIGIEKTGYPKTKEKMYRLISIPYEAMPEKVLGFDSMDIILIGSSLLQEQKVSILSTVKQWVKEGGTVVIDMENELLQNYMGVEEEKAVTVQDDLGKPLYKVFHLDRGIVIQWLCQYDFIDIFNESTEYVKDILYGLRAYYSKHTLDKLYQEKYVNKAGEKILIDSLESLEKEYLPKPIIYAVYMFVYAIIAGPLLYFILKKKKKLIFYYIGVIGVSTLFIIVLVLYSVKFHLDEFIIHSVTVYNYESGIEDVKEETFFSIVLPNSEEEKFTIKNKTDTILKNASLDSYITSAKTNKTKLYNVSIHDTEEDSNIVINNPLYMKPYVFESESSFKTTGEICTSLTFDGQNVTGYLDNHLGYDLENAILLSNFRIIPIGRFNNGTRFSIMSSQRAIHYGEMYQNEQEIIEYATNFSRTLNQENLKDYQKCAALQYCFKEKCFRYNNESYVIGFVRSGDAQTENTDEIQNKNDIKVIVYHLNDVKKQQGKKRIITDIGEYEKANSGKYDRITRKMQDYNVKIDYYIPPDMKVNTLMYSEKVNENIHFDGTISIFNEKKQGYEQVFTDGKNLTVDKLCEKHYISKHNKITIQYSLSEQNVGMEKNVIPVISAIEEVD